MTFFIFKEGDNAEGSKVYDYCRNKLQISELDWNSIQVKVFNGFMLFVQAILLDQLEAQDTFHILF